MVLGSGGQKDAAEAAGTAAGAAATTAAAGSDGTAEPAKASTADGEPHTDWRALSP